MYIYIYRERERERERCTWVGASREKRVSHPRVAVEGRQMQRRPPPLRNTSCHLQVYK